MMAAGRGIRMKSSLPKPLHRVAGLPLVAHTVRAASAVAPERTILVVAPESQELISRSLDIPHDCVEQTKLLGTGDALTAALASIPFSSGDLLLMSSDMPMLTERTIRDLTQLHSERSAAVSLVTAQAGVGELENFGVLERGARRKPLAIVEDKESRSPRPRIREVNLGVYAIDASWVRGAMDHLVAHGDGEIYVTDLVERAVADGRRVEVLPVKDNDEALGVNNRVQLAAAERAMQKRLREAAMDNGATLVDPDTTYFDLTVSVEKDVVVHPNTSLRGHTHLGTGSQIGPNAYLTDAEIEPNAVVRGAVVERAKVGNGSHVGPFAHLRADTVLGAGVHVGSHAEIKASYIGSGTHIGHFSYIGDASIGSQSNIGAGTVTCNFDGKSKQRTDIGDGAFIGSDTLLVAPVTVGAGAMTGAGAVVTRDVSAGERVVGVPANPLRAKRTVKQSKPDDEGGQSLG